ncbi:MAG TPA: Ig domain-containing protein [Terriglobales bacterium]|nr:Ig domain-containing protein [Terriglobales bacterium]
MSVKGWASPLMLALALVGLGPRPASSIRIVESRLPDCFLGEEYDAGLHATAGSEPLKWEVVKGRLPAGLKLEPGTGRVLGRCEATGDVTFAVRVTDASKPPQTAEQEFTLRVPPPLVVKWKDMPAVRDGGIHGSVTLTNGLKDEYEVTLIIVAVNEVGKAFALGYRHHSLRAQARNEDIEFGGDTVLPRGRYIVHVDAVGEDLTKKKIYRARVQAQDPLNVP